MQRLLAIAGLTWKAALRFRLFIVVAALLLAAVVGLPILIKDDGTARGFTQILLTYTLSTIAALLGLSTLWLACGSAKVPTFVKELEVETDRRLKAALEKSSVTALDEKLLRQQIKEGLKAGTQIIPPGAYRPWQINLGFAKHFLRNQPLYLRV